MAALTVLLWLCWLLSLPDKHLGRILTSTSRMLKPSRRPSGATVSQPCNSNNCLSVSECTSFCFNTFLFVSRTALWHKRGDSQHRVQLGLHHQDPLHQRRRDVTGSGVGGRGRWGLMFLLKLEDSLASKPQQSCIVQRQSAVRMSSPASQGLPVYLCLLYYSLTVSP